MSPRLSEMIEQSRDFRLPGKHDLPELADILELIDGATETAHSSLTDDAPVG